MKNDEKRATTFTFELADAEQRLLLDVVSRGNYERREVPYSLFSIVGEKFNATLYEKEKHGRRKLCVQGSGARDFVEFQLEPNGVVPVSLGYEKVLSPEAFSPHAGSDESGKGDFFGPLVVCCAYTDEALSDKMAELGVKDCKQMSDKAVLATGAKLRALLGPDGYAVVKLGPAAYNRLYAKIRNINRMLAWAHGTAIEELLEKRPDCPRVVVDQFAPTEETIARALKERGKKAAVEQRHKAESDIAVAAASVIARENFLRSIADMTAEVFGEQADGGSEAQKVPAGSSDPRVKELAAEMVAKHGATWLMNHCKAHFKTTDAVLAACGKSRDDLPPEGRIVSQGARQDTLNNKTQTGQKAC